MRKCLWIESDCSKSQRYKKKTERDWMQKYVKHVQLVITQQPSVWPVALSALLRFSPQMKVTHCSPYFEVSFLTCFGDHITWSECVCLGVCWKIVALKSIFNLKSWAWQVICQIFTLKIFDSYPSFIWLLIPAGLGFLFSLFIWILGLWVDCVL